MAWFRCGGGGSGPSEKSIIHIEWADTTQNIQQYRTVSVDGYSLSSPVTNSTNCVGLMVMPIEIPDGCNCLIIKYDIIGPSYESSGFYPTIFFDNNNTISDITQRTGSYGYKALTQKQISSGQSDLGNFDCLKLPGTLPSNLYFKFQFGCTNFDNVKLFAAKVGV